MVLEASEDCFSSTYKTVSGSRWPLLTPIWISIFAGSETSVAPYASPDCDVATVAHTKHKTTPRALALVRVLSLGRWLRALALAAFLRRLWRWLRALALAAFLCRLWRWLWALAQIRSLPGLGHLSPGLFWVLVVGCWATPGRSNMPHSSPFQSVPGSLLSLIFVIDIVVVTAVADFLSWSWW